MSVLTTKACSTASGQLKFLGGVQSADHGCLRRRRPLTPSPATGPFFASLYSAMRLARSGSGV